MASRNFTTGLVIRIILLLATIFATGTMIVVAVERDLFFIPLMLAVILVLQVTEFVFYVKRINRTLATMMDTLKDADHTTTLSAKSGMPLKGLQRTLTEITEYIRKLKIEKVAQYEYLQSVVGHIHIGIISVRENDEIEFINDPALSLLGIERPENWDMLSDMAPRFTGMIDKIRGKGSTLVEYRTEQFHRWLSVKVSSLVILREEMRIITFQDIRAEIEQKEAEAWQKLIRILRHEIMNSVTPISSMTETILMLLEDHLGAARKASDLNDEDIRDIRESVSTIHDRSEGLNHFLEQYREVTRIPSLKKSDARVSDLVENALKLLETELEARDIETRISQGDPELEITADASLIEQVLINILKNSMEALNQEEKKTIEIRTGGDNRSKLITVTDNGHGISAGDMDEIFVPFYSTKKEGSGIGLSLSRQIMHLHGGEIFASSIQGEGTSMTLVFYD
jgi:nitrogen fixation/metabolism regulation signal transduction histidine kinase